MDSGDTGLGTDPEVGPLDSGIGPDLDQMDSVTPLLRGNVPFFTGLS